MSYTFLLCVWKTTQNLILNEKYSCTVKLLVPLLMEFSYQFDIFGGNKLYWVKISLKVRQPQKIAGTTTLFHSVGIICILELEGRDSSLHRRRGNPPTIYHFNGSIGFPPPPLPSPIWIIPFIAQAPSPCRKPKPCQSLTNPRCLPKLTMSNLNQPNLT